MRIVSRLISLAFLVVLSSAVSGCTSETTDSPEAGRAAGSAAEGNGSSVTAGTREAGGAGAGRRDIVNTEKKRYSQFDEELCIRDFFQDRRDGFFLDVGCAFPRRGSTTFYLEKHLGWTGIGVDALSEYAPNWAKVRPDSKFFTFLISDHSDTEDTFYRSPWLQTSSAKKEMVEKYDYEERKVVTITINKLLEDNGVEKLDFMSMDIEGYQMTALAGFDIEKYKPELVCMEAYRPDRPRINAWFEERGYKRIDRYLEHDRINWYYTPVGNPALSIK